MSAEPQSAPEIKYITIRMKKKLKNNSAIIHMIKEAGELFVKVLLFLLCCENPEKIEFDFLKGSLKPKNTEDGEILQALDFWQEKDVLEYEITSIPNPKGINIENVINIMLNVRRDIDILNGEDYEAEETQYQEGPVIYEEKKEPEKAAPVSVDQVCESLETKDEFKRLIHETQKRLQVIFNTAEYVIMYNLHETNGMEVDLLLTIAEMCAEDGKKNIRYIEKVALGMVSDGILKMNQYEDKIREMHEIKEFEEKIKNLFEAPNKKLTSKERNYIKKWFKEYSFPDEMLSEGYRQCLKYTEKLSFEYINTIFSNWHEKGFGTLEDIKNEFGPERGEVKKNAAYNVEQFFEKRLKKI